MGRKNFLFANTPYGAKASAIAYSLIETAKENGLNPYEYLLLLLSALPDRKDGELLAGRKTCPGALPLYATQRDAAHDTDRKLNRILKPARH